MNAEALRAGSISGTMAARVCMLAGGLITGIATARVLGPDGRGHYFGVTTAAAILAQLSNLGLTSSNVFFGARDRNTIRPLLVNSTALALAVGLVSAAAVTFGGAQVSRMTGVPPVMLWAICLLGAATLLWNLGASLLVAMERFAALNYWQVANVLTAVAATLTCVALRASASQFALATALSASATAVGMATFIAGRGSGPGRPSLELAMNGIGFSLRAYLALLFAYLLQRSGASLLVASSSAEQLGQYSIASQVFDVLLIVPASISLVLYPLLVRRTDDLWHHVRRTALLTTAAMTVLCGVAAVAAPTVLPLVFGARFAGSIPALWVLLPTVIAYTVVSVLSQYLVARNFPWSVVLAWAVGLVGALLAGTLLTRTYGAVGAGVSQSCGALIVCGMILAITWRRTGRRVSKGSP